MPNPSQKLPGIKITNKGPLDLARDAYAEVRHMLSYPAAALTALPELTPGPEYRYDANRGISVATGRPAGERYRTAFRDDKAAARAGTGIPGMLADPANLVPVATSGNLARRAAQSVAAQAMADKLEGRPVSPAGLALAAFGGFMPQGSRPASPSREGATWAQDQLDGLLPLDQMTIRRDPDVLKAYGLPAPTMHTASMLDPSITRVPLNRAPGTSREIAYQEWAGKRPLVTPSGQPLIMFHGTSDPSIALRDKGFRRYTGQSGAFLGQGSYFAPSPGEAETWAGLQALTRGHRDNRIPNGAQILPVHLAADNPLIIPNNVGDQYKHYYEMLGISPKVAAAAQAANPDAAAEITHALTSRGHDAVIRTGPMRSVLEAFLPNPEGRVKSIFNSGTWDRNNIDMLKSIPAAMGAGLLYRASQSQQKEQQ